MTRLTKFNYVGPINATGYGVASTHYMEALLKENSHLGVGVIGNPNVQLDETVQAAIQRTDYDAPVFCFWHLFDIPERITQYKGIKVGYTTFELDTLSSKDIEAINKLNLIGTASKWGKSILDKYTDPSKTFIVNHAFNKEPINLIDFNISCADRNKKLHKTWTKLLNPIGLSTDTLFLSAVGKFESRKGYPELIDACIKLGKTKPIVLIAYFYNPFIRDNFPFGYINSKYLYPEFTNSSIKVYKKNNFRLVLMPPAPSRNDLFSAIEHSHYFIAPSKGEGWNLPLYEAMSIGVPSIATLYSAHTEYCNQHNVIPINASGLVAASDGVFFNGSQGNWLDVKQENIQDAIEVALAHKDDQKFLNTLINNARKATNQSWQQTGRKIQQLMNQY